MCGLPRTGTTLLSAILSQNASVYLSPQSDLSEHLRNAHQYTSEVRELGVLSGQRDNLIKGIPAAFYGGDSGKTVIDKSRSWGNPYFLRLLTKVLGESPRILCPVRPLVEVMASFINKAQQNPDINYIDQKMVTEDFLPYWRKPLDDARVDWLLSTNGLLQTSMLSVASAYKDETARMFHIYTYSDLVNNPIETINGIYRFLGLEPYPHNFDVIPKAEYHADFEVLGIPDMHTVRSTLQVTSPRPEDVLSDYAITRCEIEDFWTDKLLP